VNKRRLLSLVAAIVATILIGYFVLQQLKWNELVALGRASDFRFLGLGFLAYCLANYLRAARFRTLVGDRIQTGTMLRTVLIQNLLNTFLPLRAGEASYLFMVHRTGVKAGDNISSLLGARLLDLLAALLLPIAALPLSHAWAAQRGSFGWIAAPPLLGLLVLSLGLSQAERLAELVRSRANSSRAWLNRGLLLASDVLRSFAQLQRGAVLGRVAALTAACWSLLYLSGYFSLRGVGLTVPFFDCVFAYSFPVVASMMPFYMLGGFGVYEGTLGVGLNLIGVPLGVATAASLALHVAELLFIVVPAPLTLLPQLWPQAPQRELERSNQGPPGG
jgi:uncharacterized membrane protein YbhN (UPF0104 family)